MLKDQLNALLPLVQKPARYTGGELNSVIKDPAQMKARVAFCFADVYEVGMSHLGLRILYDCLNKRYGASGYARPGAIWKRCCGSGGCR